MPMARNQLAGDQKFRWKSGRKPLQPKNSPVNTANETPITKTKLKQEWIEIEISAVGESNKENHPIYTAPKKIETLELDSSLAEELSAVRKKMERLRQDKEKTEKMLRERGEMLDLQMKEMECRGKIQKEMEIEVDRLFRLKELQSLCMRVSPVRSLRVKEQQKRITEGQSPVTKSADLEESVGENTSPSSGSASDPSIKEENDDN